jgi:hypothetical protein
VTRTCLLVMTAFQCELQAVANLRGEGTNNVVQGFDKGSDGASGSTPGKINGTDGIMLPRHFGSLTGHIFASGST